MLDISKYQIFVRVVELGNITRAAEVLNYTQSAVSHTIKDMEESMGISLFVRSKTGVKLTEVGKEVYKICVDIVNKENILDKTIRKLGGANFGVVKVGLFREIITNWLPQIVKKIQEENRDIIFDFTISDMERNREALIRDEVDCAFITKEYSQGVNFFPLYEDEYRVILPNNHKLTFKNKIKFSDIEKEDIIIREGLDSLLQKQLNKKNIPIKYRIRDSYGVVAMVEQGLGVGILTKLALNNISADLVIKEIENKPNFRTIGIAVHDVKYMTPMTKLFIDEARLVVSSYIAYLE